MKGIPNLDSLPKESSGKDTPISEMAICSDEMPAWTMLYIIVWAIYTDRVFAVRASLIPRPLPDFICTC